MTRDWSMDDVESLIELPEIYDGWSVARLTDGRLVNRWDMTEYPSRWRATEEVLRRWKQCPSCCCVGLV